MSEFLHTRQAAERLGVSYTKFIREIGPKLTKYRLGGENGRYSYKVSDLDAHASKSAIYPTDRQTRRTIAGRRDLERKLRSNPIAKSLLARIGGEDAA